MPIVDTHVHLPWLREGLHRRLLAEEARQGRPRRSVQEQAAALALRPGGRADHVNSEFFKTNNIWLQYTEFQYFTS